MSEELQMCNWCSMGRHDYCFGTCAEGEHNHPDPSDTFRFNRELTDPHGRLPRRREEESSAS